MRNLNKSCQYCETRHHNCHSGCPDYIDPVEAELMRKEEYERKAVDGYFYERNCNIKNKATKLGIAY